MKILALSTSSPRCSVALADEGAVLVSRAVDEDRLHAERIFPMIDELLAEVRWTKRDVALVACDLGPGSFTGVRVGLASAKGIALGLGLPIVGVGSLEAMARAAHAVNPTADILAVLDARRAERFVAAWVRGAIRMGPIHVPTSALEGVACELGAGWVWCGDAGGVLDDDRRVVASGCGLPDARWIAQLARERWSARGPDDLESLEPLYVRPPDAKLPATPPDWRARGGSAS